MSVQTSRIFPLVMLLLTSAVLGKDETPEQSGIPQPLSSHVLQELPAYQGGNLNRFHRGGNGEVVLDCGGDKDIATADGGQTWHAYRGDRVWPTGYLGPFQVGEEQIAISENDYKGALSRRSIDAGRTWEDPVAIPAAESNSQFPKLRGPYFFSVTLTRGGRLLIPEDYLTGAEGPDPDVLSVHSSGDGARTWFRSSMIEPPEPLPKKPEGFGEPAIAELADGQLWMVFRSTFGELWQCLSNDGGLTWGAPSSTGLASPMSNPRAATIPGTHTVVLVWDFAKPGQSANWGSGPSAANGWGPRTPLVMAVSHDGCRSWSCPTILDDRMAFYANLHFTESELFILYEFVPRDSSPNKNAIVVFRLDDLKRQPAWTRTTIQPYIKAGLVAPWLVRNLTE